MKYKTSHYLIVPVAAFAVAFVGLTSATALDLPERAQQAREAAESRSQDVQQAASQRGESLQGSTAREEALQRRDAKLEENRLKVCQKRESTIKSIMTRMQSRGERQLEVFTTIADRTKAFYAENQLSAAGYDDAVAVVEDKKLLAQTAVYQGSAAVEDFDCTANDPLALKDAFKSQLSSQIEALNAYKTAVKDLIVTVKSSQALQEDSQGSEESNDAGAQQ